MKVICTNNQYLFFPKNLLSPGDQDHLNLNSVVQGLTVSKTYTVYGTFSISDNPGYFICDDYRESYPIGYSSNFFNVIDCKISRYWISCIKEDRKANMQLFIGFPEWANEEYFLYNLVEGEEREVNLFEKYKQLMDLEFPDPAITQMAQIGDENWLICPSCIEAWENSNFQDALVICPLCEQTFCNPRWPCCINALTGIHAKFIHYNSIHLDF